jgi:hypothetical protein
MLRLHVADREPFAAAALIPPLQPSRGESLVELPATLLQRLTQWHKESAPQDDVSALVADVTFYATPACRILSYIAKMDVRLTDPT